ncbi:D-alanine--D-alanine ligase [Microbaculum marinisediminis]|uniref:D-alanine--D-alanine ligase n=1 Tax=Microbaculum marinisediminis TaxID=2931392 RepID=A0AAW5QZU4_9HYPH|nr:D-alanine--D-alanine ligase [Microbaculum sp. A6E488]MCT8972580.1 D-alanine--D-alanine ligase [Microbaculum sp. A6E488]
MTKHVAVLLGGWSAEREVSLASGKACGAALEGEGYKVTYVDVDRDLAIRLGEVKPDVVFNALHGPYGEDGTVQGMLEIMGLPYTHSGVLASALAMRKAHSRTIFKAAGIPIADGKVVHRLTAAESHVFPPPYVLKPEAQGSSFGVFIVREDQAHPPQELFSSDWKYGDYLLAERYVAGKELTCAVMGNVALGVIDVVPTQGFYDYAAKYVPGGSKHVLPAEIKPNVYQEVQKLALKAHRALGCRGVSRADFRYDDRAEGTTGLVCLEVNTQPGMTETSLVPEMAAHAGHSFGDLVRWMVEDASCNR